MVTNLAEKIDFNSEFTLIESKRIEDPIKWCSVSLSELIERGSRLEASVFDVDTKIAVSTIKSSKFGYEFLLHKDGDVKKAYHAPRFKRNYVPKLHADSIGFLGSAEMLDIKPIAKKNITKKLATRLNLFVNKGNILLSCSGTIGNLTYVNRTLEQYAFSQHIIRLECDNYSGYIYACLSSSAIQKQIQSLIYGAVIQELEPHHLERIIIPSAPQFIKEKIHNLIVRSFELRDESNILIEQATALLIQELQLSSIEEFKQNSIEEKKVQTFNLPLSKLTGRLDASYHIPLIEAIHTHLKAHADEVVTIADKRISKNVILAGVFKRVYVKKECGIPFLGGKEITQLNPNVEKFLSKPHHEKRYMKELKVEKNMILVTDRGTIGTTVLVPQHFSGWAVSQNVLKLIPANDDIAGYLFIFLESEIGNVLIKRQTYGSVIDMIDNKNLLNVSIPLLKNKNIQTEINNLALLANEKRYEAYLLEQEALDMMEKEVIYAK